MKTTRRDFLKGLFATGATLAVAPHLIVELVHGASDLTPQERDVAAEVMGLRTRQWSGIELWHPKTMRRTTWADGAIMRDRIDDWDFKHGNLVMFPEAKTELLIDGEWQSVHVKFTEEETAWKRRSIIVPVAESSPWPDGSLRFGQMEVPFLDSGEPDWDYVTRAMRELEGQTGDRVSVRWGAEDDPLFFFDRGLYEYGT